MEKTRGRGRPPVTTREAVEDVAMALFEERGIENTTVVDIAEACEMSKTSFFRYFASKNEILWGPFESMVQRLDEALRTVPEERPIMDAVGQAIRDQVEIELQRADAWVRRFKFQNTEEQRSLALINWGIWEGVIADFVRERSHSTAESLIPEAIAGATRAAMRAFLRVWGLSGQTDVSGLLADFDKKFMPVLNVAGEYISRIPRDDE